MTLFAELFDSKLLQGAVLLSALFGWLVATILYNYLLHPLRHVPGPFWYSCIPGAWKWVVLRGYPDKTIMALHEQYGPVVRFRADAVSFASMSALRQIYSSHSFRKHKEYLAFNWKEPNSFSATDPDFSKKRRRMLTPVFSPTNIASLEPVIFEAGIKPVLDEWYSMCADSETNSNKVELYDTFFMMALGTIARLAFGIPPPAPVQASPGSKLQNGQQPMDNSDSDIGSSMEARKTLINAIKRMDSILVSAMFVPTLVRTLLVKYVLPHFIGLIYRVRRVTTQLVHDRLASTQKQQQQQQQQQQQGGVKHSDILQLMIDTYDPETGEKLSMENLGDESLVMMVAGTETTGNTMTFTFDMLFAHPRVMEKLEREITAAFPDPSVHISYKDAKQQLPYLEAVLLESMRIRTVAGGYLMRVVPYSSKDGGVVIDGYELPTGTMVGVSGHVVHNYSALWEQPDKFIPERFIEGDLDVVTQRKQQVIPFSVGVRACIGRQLAMTELIVGIATLIQHFVIRPAAAEYKQLDPQYKFVLSPKGKKLDACVTPRCPKE